MTEKQYVTWCRVMDIFQRVFRCHQLAERSFHIKGVQLPLCARCTGLVIGFLLCGPLVTAFAPENMFVSMAFVVVMCLDGFLQLVGILPSTNIRRLITGLLAGYALFSFPVHVVERILFLCK